jgi:hypothetical protein
MAPGHGRRHGEKVDGQKQGLRFLEGARRGAQRDEGRREEQGGGEDHQAAQQGVSPGDVDHDVLGSEAQDLHQGDGHRGQVEHPGEGRQGRHGQHLAEASDRRADGRAQDRLQRAALALARGHVDGGIEGAEQTMSTTKRGRALDSR